MASGRVTCQTLLRSAAAPDVGKAGALSRGSMVSSGG